MRAAGEKRVRCSDATHAPFHVDGVCACPGCGDTRTATFAARVVLPIIKQEVPKGWRVSVRLMDRDAEPTFENITAALREHVRAGDATGCVCHRAKSAAAGPMETRPLSLAYAAAILASFEREDEPPKPRAKWMRGTKGSRAVRVD